MGFEKVALYGIIDADLEATGTGVLTLKTDLPGNALAVRETKAITATARRVVRFRLQGTTKGRLYVLKVTPANGCVIRLYGARIWARVLPGLQWAWYDVPVPKTSEEWTAVKLEIPPVSEWAQVKLPIPPMSDWSEVKLPIKPTPANPEWVNIPVDQ